MKHYHFAALILLFSLLSMTLLLLIKYSVTISFNLLILSVNDSPSYELDSDRAFYFLAKVMFEALSFSQTLSLLLPTGSTSLLRVLTNLKEYLYFASASFRSYSGVPFYLTANSRIISPNDFKSCYKYRSLLSFSLCLGAFYSCSGISPNPNTISSL